jgi:hypothetical protein
MEQLGIEVADSEGNIKSLNEILLELRAGLDGLSEADRVTALNELVGLRAGASFSVLINFAGQGELAEFTSALENDVTQASDIAAQQLDTLKGDFDLFNSAIEGVKLSIGNEWLPIWRMFVQSSTDFVGEVAPEVVAFFAWLARNAEEALPTILRLAHEGFAGLREFLTGIAAAYDQDGLQGVFDLLVSDLQTLWLEQIYPTLNGWAIDFWDWLDLTEATGPENLNSLLDSITLYLKENWPTIAATLDEWSTLFWGWVATTSEAAGEKLAPVLDNLQTWAGSDDAKTRINTLGQTIGGILFDSLQLQVTNQERANNLMFGLAETLVVAAGSLVPRLIELGELLAISILSGFVEKLTGFDATPYLEGIVKAFSPIGQLEDAFSFATDTGDGGGIPTRWLPPSPGTQEVRGDASILLPALEEIKKLLSLNKELVVEMDGEKVGNIVLNSVMSQIYSPGR